MVNKFACLSMLMYKILCFVMKFVAAVNILCLSIKFRAIQTFCCNLVGASSLRYIDVEPLLGIGFPINCEKWFLWLHTSVVHLELNEL